MVTNGTGAHSVHYEYDDAAGNLGNLTHKSDITTLPVGAQKERDGLVDRGGDGERGARL